MKINSAGDLAAAVRGRRISLGLSQADLAAQAGVSRPWLSKVEAGRPTAEFGLVLRLLDALGLSLDVDESDGGGTNPTTASVDLDDLLDGYRNQ